MTDSYTDELFDLPGHADRLVFPVSRLLVDAERFISDADEPMAQRGMGVVYTRTHDGRVLKSDRDRATLIARYYVPHHAQLEEWVDDRLTRFGRCLVIDCHSFSSSPLLCDLDQATQRPDICIGTTEPHSAPGLVRAAVEAFEALGYTVEINRPYAGTIVPLSVLGKNSACSSIMIEVNRRLYMNEQTGDRLTSFSDLVCQIGNAVRGIVDYWHSPTAKAEQESLRLTV
jgi:N-formylglutamate deformylase